MPDDDFNYFITKFREVAFDHNDEGKQKFQTSYEDNYARWVGTCSELKSYMMDKGGYHYDMDFQIIVNPGPGTI